MVTDPEAFFTIPQTGKIPKPEKVAVLMKQLQDEVKNKYPALTLDSHVYKCTHGTVWTALS